MDAIKTDYTQADLDPATKALLDACIKLTRRPWEMSQQNVDELRSTGLSDEMVNDGFQVAAYFNYINRVADGLGVDLEQEMPAEPDGWKEECPYL